MKGLSSRFRSVLLKRFLSGGNSLRLMGVSLVLVVLGLTTFSLYTQYFQRVPEGVQFLGQDFSGMNRVAVKNILSEQFQDWSNQPLAITVMQSENEGEIYETRLSDLGYSYDVLGLVNRMMKLPRIQADLLGLPSSATVDVEPIVEVDLDRFETFLQHVLGVSQVENASLYLDEADSQWKLKEHQVGYGVSSDERRRFQNKLQELALSPQENASFVLALESIEPEYLTSDFEDLFAGLQGVLDRSVSWFVDGHTVTLSLSDHPWMVDVDLADKQIAFSEEAVSRFVEDWARAFDRQPGRVLLDEASVQEAGYLQTTFQGHFDHGRCLDREAMKADLLRALEEGSEEIVLVYEALPPQVLSADGHELELLSQGRSSYRLGNGADRVYNVQFGLSKYDGVVIPQGEEFSFNQVLGWVIYEDGWRPALAIFGGGGVRKVPGGGLCQVSTTVYRAAVHGGLSITQRKPHSLDVSYYHEYGYGIDATIYPPADLDLKFLNDTPGDIVIHSYVDPVSEEAFVEFYGVDDGRQIELEQVVNRDVILPTQYVQTEEIPSGVQEVERRGRVGRYIEWSWTVKKANGDIDQRLIETLYPAEPRKVLVGM